MTSSPRLYRDLARWWPLFSAPEHYAEEAAALRELFAGALHRMPRTVLELGSGGGNLASHLVPHTTMTLTDLSEDMLQQSRALNPGVEHVQGDMRTLRLGRRFEAVLIHDAIMYMTQEQDLVAALATARAHVQEDGVTVVLPDAVAETHQPTTDLGGDDAKDGSGRGIRWIEWSHAPRAGETLAITDYVLALRAADGTLEVVHDRHAEGIFSRAAWRACFLRAGFASVEIVADPWRHDVFIARPR